MLHNKRRGGLVEKGTSLGRSKLFGREVDLGMMEDYNGKPFMKK